MKSKPHHDLELVDWLDQLNKVTKDFELHLSVGDSEYVEKNWGAAEDCKRMIENTLRYIGKQ